jgi:hypothetical protein
MRISILWLEPKDDGRVSVNGTWSGDPVVYTVTCLDEEPIGNCIVLLYRHYHQCIAKDAADPWSRFELKA